MIVVDVESTGVDAKLCSLLSVGALDFDNPSNQFYMECFAFDGAHIEKEALAIAGFALEEIKGNGQSPKDNNQPNTTTSASPRLTDAVHLSHSEDRTLKVLRSSTSSLLTSSTKEGKSLHAEDGGAPFKKGRIKTTDKELVCAFLEWMKTCNEWTLAGQNPSFDGDFLQETAHRYHIDWPLAHRTIDLHTVAYAEFLRIGKEIPRKNNHSALNLDRILEYVGLSARAKSHNALEDAKLEAEAFARLLKGKELLEEYKRLPLPSGTR